MKQISSGWTFFYKKIFPAMWFGFLAFFIIVISDGADDRDALFVMAPILLGVFAVVVLKKLVWDLVDEVHDYGDYLLIRNKGEEEKVAIANIMNVSPTTYTNPPRITLRLVTPSRFGSEIAFSPVSGMGFNPFAKNPVAEDLIVRVDRARATRAA